LVDGFISSSSDCHKGDVVSKFLILTTYDVFSIRFVDQNIYRVVDRGWLEDEIERYPTRTLYKDALKALKGKKK